MTPLAHHLARLLTLPIAKREDWAGPKSSANLRAALTDIHCFEVTAIKPLLQELGDRCHAMGKEQVRETFGTNLFLPAPKTWIEMSLGTAPPEEQIVRPYRMAWLSEEDAENKRASFTLFLPNCAYDFARVRLHDGLFDMTELQRSADLPKTMVKSFPTFFWWAIYALILINTPRIFGRRQMMPHRGLERRLTRSFGPGKFPLHAWTEIRLEVSKPPEIDDGEAHDAHLTGRRALHFCRKHLRIRLGQLEYVSAHWRGDPAIGIKRSRYLVRQ